ncbi:hypothetical protein LRP30_37530 [Bradyrhizobium sp. C-145]|uniref:hypothetical protein n=1 Tax=Bradyrhizobium sp. C-145 TaxID=574727 RepID=UPI00201B54F8|nr:hypothetical protein [Bradyrhizobium sp. C-145]UQR62395.1 hypothetical protein LRP30_37530 [Bradyrhizobium sp. C-145]
MAASLYPPSSREPAEKRRALAPDIENAFQAFSQKVFADSALSKKTKRWKRREWQSNLKRGSGDGD